MTKVKPDHIVGRIVVHELDQAVTALTVAHALDCPIALLSATGAARSSGPAWWRELVTQAQTLAPGPGAHWILDCADEPGMALAALREGITSISLEAEGPVWSRVSEIAAQCGASLQRPDRANALDLAGSNNPQNDCKLYLSTLPEGVAKPDALG
ncbi:MAG: hypothetical protein CL573_02025 [Alphaproteobacteria bacterium]|nr:hypothetical protein [Alphaproteobacteria bacterium]